MQSRFKMKCILVILAILLLAACTPQVTALTPTAQTAARNTGMPVPTAAPTRTPTPAPGLTPTLASSLTPAPLSTETASLADFHAWPTFAVTSASLTYAGVRVTENRLGSAADYSLDEGDARNDEFYGRIPAEMVAWPTTDGDPFKLATPEAFNAVLKRFGYRLEGAASPYTLYKGQQALSQNITYAGNYALNQSGSDFFALLTVDNAQVWLLQKARFELYFEGKPRVAPIFLGDRLLVVDFLTTDEGTFALVKDGQKVIYTSPRTALGPETCPVDFFRAWQNHWLMQLDGQVVLDGRPLGADLGYQKAFNWRLIGGKPAYLFQKGGRYGISYDGHELAPQYDQIAQVDCVVGAYTYPFAAWGMDGTIRFYARRAGDWYLVEVK